MGPEEPNVVENSIEDDEAGAVGEGDPQAARLNEQHTTLIALGAKLRITEQEWVRADIMPLDDGEMMVLFEAVGGHPVGDAAIKATGIGCVGLRAAHAIEILVDMRSNEFEEPHAVETWPRIAKSPMAMTEKQLREDYARVSLAAFRIAVEAMERRPVAPDVARHLNTQQQAYVAARRGLLGMDPFGDDEEPDPGDYPRELDPAGALQAARALVRSHRKQETRVRRQVAREERRGQRRVEKSSRNRKPKKH